MALPLDPNAPVPPQLNSTGQPIPVVAPIPFAVQTYTIVPAGSTMPPHLPRTKENFWRKFG